MPHVFALPRPNDTIAVFEKLKDKLAATGGKLTGNESEGTISVNGTQGRYVVEPDAIQITVTKKPSSLIPNKLVEKEIRAVFREICG